MQPNIIKINSFYDVLVTRKSLIVLDIDDTTLMYDNVDKKWWNEKFEHYYKKTNNYDNAEKCVLHEWKCLIATCVPKHVDKVGFEKLFFDANQNNCKLIFLTARNESLSMLTYEHLSHLDINNIKVYFSSEITKGETLNNLLKMEYAEYIDVIIVDDLIGNLETIIENVNGKNLQCYLMEAFV